MSFATLRARGSFWIRCSRAPALRQISLCTGGAVVCWLMAAGGAPAQTSRPADEDDLPVAVCVLRDRRITEASGIVESRKTPGLYYIHNDSGDEPRVFLVDRSGRTRNVIRLTGARNVDWEDIAVAPGSRAGEWDICVADIGDNDAKRAELTVYRFPDVQPTGAAGATIDVAPRAYRFRYEGGPHDAEGFAVHPQSGDGYVLTKGFDGATDVYKLAAPWNAEGVAILKRVATMRLPDAPALATVVTAADIAPDGRRLATRSYLCGWEWRLPDDGEAGAFERIFATTPTKLNLAAEPQGEGLCYSVDGGAILTVSEKTPTTLYEWRRGRDGAGRGEKR